jgi:hypothetical protein
MFSPIEQLFPLDCPSYENHGLFADHYLREPQRLRAMEEWKQPTASLEEARDKIVRLYRKHASRFNSHTNEAQTEKHFICPVLDLLWGANCYEVQPPIPNVEGRRQSDYGFFRTAEEKQEADKHKGSLEYWRNAPALGDAKAWESSLDRQTGPGENPSAQICNYLYRSRARWGILTNGRLWRLYERDKSSAGGIYYEVNLVDLLDRRDGESFKYFYLFFRREAFIPDPKDPDRLSFVEKVFKGSADYATEVGERLKESVYDALRHLMNGFLAHPANGLDSSDADAVQLVHDNSLVLLYRLLFILYAEDRPILPCENEEYGRYSLRVLHKEINANLLRRPYSTKPTALWGRLCELFSLIDCGFEEDGRVVVPAYNGGLFFPEKHPHIAYTAQANVKQWQIGDRYLAEAVDLLAYERKQWDKPTSDHVDYATLDVQHLGSIYEGLLELQPHIATTPLVEVSEKGKSTFRPETEVPDPRPIRGQPPRRIKPGEVYLVTNRGERKATGSYYTPKYIVDYIVENTVGPVAEEAAIKVAELRTEVDKEIKKLERTRREWEKSSARDAPEHIAGLNKLIEDQKRRLLEPYLALKILDPAMGSGHFLVGAADHLSLNMATDPNLIPPEETDSENVQAFYKRLIVERCLYGVDLNPLAVELAKLSLWLHTVSKGKALSFLDHHLRCGNSLIGARIEDDLMKTPPQFDERGRRVKTEGDLVAGMYEALHERHLVAMLELLHKISDIPTHDAATEKMKEGLYAELEKVRERFRAVANCWLGPYFGVPVAADQYQRAVKSLRNDPPSEAGAEPSAVNEAQSKIGGPQLEPWFQAAQAVAHQKHFFHWELEFPEVFFDKQGAKPKDQRGFDVVIGNPPYGRISGESERNLASGFYQTSGTVLDVFGVFIERGTALLKHERRFGVIVPSGWLTAREHVPLRAFLLRNQRPHAIVHLPYDVFPDAYVDCIVWLARKESCDADGHCLVKRFGIRESVKQMPSSDRDYSTISLSRWLADPDKLMVTETGAGVWLREWRQSHNFIAAGEIIEVTRGITPYVELPPTDSRRSSIGFFGSLGRYDLKPEKFAEVLYDESLSEYRPLTFFTGKRLIIRRIISRQHRIHATVADRPFLINKSYLVANPKAQEYELEYLLAVLNSCLLSKAFVSLSEIAKRDDFPQLDIATVSEIPIPRIAFTTPKAERVRLLKEGKALYEKMISAMTQGAK